MEIVEYENFWRTHYDILYSFYPINNMTKIPLEMFDNIMKYCGVYYGVYYGACLLVSKEWNKIYKRYYDDYYLYKRRGEEALKMSKNLSTEENLRLIINGMAGTFCL